MKGVTIRVENGKAIIEVPLDGNFGPSTTGKSIIVASTGGYKPVPDHADIKLNLTVIKGR